MKIQNLNYSFNPFELSIPKNVTGPAVALDNTLREAYKLLAFNRLCP